MVLSISSWQCTSFIIKHYLDRKKLIFWTRFLLGRWKLRSACQGIFVYPKWNCSQTHPSTADSLACGVFMWIEFVVRAEQECEGDLSCKHGYPYPWAAVMWCLICCPTGCHRLPVKRLMVLLMGLDEFLAQTRVLYYNKPWFVLHQKPVKNHGLKNATKTHFFFLYAVKPRHYIESIGTGYGGFLDFYFHFKTLCEYFSSKFSTSLLWLLFVVEVRNIALCIIGNVKTTIFTKGGSHAIFFSLVFQDNFFNASIPSLGLRNVIYINETHTR